MALLTPFPLQHNIGRLGLYQMPSDVKLRAASSGIHSDTSILRPSNSIPRYCSFPALDTDHVGH